MSWKTGTVLAFCLAAGLPATSALAHQEPVSTSHIAAGAVEKPVAPKPGFRPQPGRYYLTDAEIQQIRKNVTTKPWARVAWANTRNAADAALHDTPNPAPSAGVDYRPSGRDANNQCTGPPSGWACLLYIHGLRDGEDALNLARAYAVSGDRQYALKAKEFLLAWVHTYNRPNPTVAHDVAEPAGFMLKGFLAFDLVRDVFTSSEQRQFKSWARLFIADGERRADHQVDSPPIPDQTYNGDTSNWQSFGNSEAFSRALAVTAAAVVGGRTLTKVLAWNWDHTTPGGHDNGWATQIDGEIINGTGGETFEGRARNDFDYGLFGTDPLLLIADIAKHAGYSPNLFTFTTSHGNSVLSPLLFYGRYLDSQLPWPKSGASYTRRTQVSVIYRAAVEMGLANAPENLVPALRRIVTFAGPTQRGSSFDPFINLYNALLAPR